MSTLSQQSPRPNTFVWHKRRSSESDPREAKRMRYNFYVLGPESECNSSDDGTESIYSLQGKETDYARDTTDTETKSDISDCDFEVEYDIASTEEDETFFSNHSSSGNEFEAIAGAIAGAVVAIHEDIWLTDDDDDSESNDVPDSLQLLSEQKCRRCKTRNTVGCFTLCSHCHQIRKTYYPPRPRKYKHKKSSQQLSQTSNLSTELQKLINTSPKTTSSDSENDKLMLGSQETIALSTTLSQKSFTSDFSEPKTSSMESSDFLSQRSEISEIVRKFEMQKTNSEISALKSSLTLELSTEKTDLDILEKPSSSKTLLEKPGTSSDLSTSIVNFEFKKEESKNTNFSSELLTPSSEIAIQKLRSVLSTQNSDFWPVFNSTDSTVVENLSQKSTSSEILNQNSTVSESENSPAEILTPDSGVVSGSSQETIPSLDSMNENSSGNFGNGRWKEWALAINEKCMICNIEPKNGIFLHNSDAHMCCCYSCAVKFWNSSKKCAYCQRKCKNVVKAFIV